MDEYTTMVLEKYGWTVECESPFEIRNEDGSFASLQAAQIVLNYVIEQDVEDQECQNN